MAGPDPEEGRAPFPRALPALLLLPGALLVAGRSGAALSADDPWPATTATGLVGLGLVPLALLLLLRPGRGRAPGLALWAGAWALGLVAARAATDTFELARALGLAAVTGLALAAGERLTTRGRGYLVLFACLLSVVWTFPALLQHALSLEPDLGGILGNTGTLSQAALPGAVAGVWLLASDRGGRAGLGLLAALGFVMHAVLAPVLAGGLAFLVGVALLFLARREPEARRRTRAGLALVLVVTVAAFGLRAVLRDGPTGSEAEASAPAALESDTGGLEVRWRIGRSTLGLIADHPLLGVGPGQFRAAFPPYRDPVEAALSRHGACSEADTEVEHAHQDPLQLAAELGLPAGLLLAALLALVLVRSLRGLRDPELVPAAAASLALLANSLAHTPLSVQPVSVLLGFSLFGAVLGARPPEPTPSRPARAGPWLVRLAALGLLATLPLAWRLVRHGNALADYIAAVRSVIEARGGRDDPLRARFETTRHSKEAADAVARALESAPDSPGALALFARSAGDPAPWRALLELRPHSFEAWENVGLLAARAGDVGTAIEAWQEALSLSPGHPRVTKNLARLELESGREADALGRLEGNPCIGDDWIRTLGLELVLKGFLTAGRATLRLAREDPEEWRPEEAFEKAGEAESAGDALGADALRTLAHWLWAREHVAEGRFPTALRSYRQALAPTLKYVPGGAPSLRRELAAAAFLAERPEEARRQLEGLAASPDEDLPGWAREALQEAGAGDR